MKTWWIGLFVCIPSLAHATPELRDALRDELMLPTRPDCSVCHLGDVTTFDSVRTPFGLALRARGVTAEDGAALRRALAILADDRIDSDLDGVEDVVELQSGTDPNLAPGREDVPVGFGCGVARRTGGSSALAIVASIAAWAITRRTRATSTRVIPRGRAPEVSIRIRRAMRRPRA